MKFQKPYVSTERPTIDMKGETRTEQAHKKQCDINYILADYVKSGYIKHSKTYEGRYDDISPTDFTQAMNTVTQARQMFEALPAPIKKQFGQNPAQFLEFVQNPENAEQLGRLGIIRGNDGLDINGLFVNSPTKVPEVAKATEPEPEQEPAP